MLFLNGGRILIFISLISCIGPFSPRDFHNPTKTRGEHKQHLFLFEFFFLIFFFGFYHMKQTLFLHLQCDCDIPAKTTLLLQYDLSLLLSPEEPRKRSAFHLVLKVITNLVNAMLCELQFLCLTIAASKVRVGRSVNSNAETGSVRHFYSSSARNHQARFADALNSLALGSVKRSDLGLRKS